jgi:hypothetical protein
MTLNPQRVRGLFGWAGRAAGGLGVGAVGADAVVGVAGAVSGAALGQAA